jgi:hypothetical protein
MKKHMYFFPGISGICFMLSINLESGMIKTIAALIFCAWMGFVTAGIRK